MDNDIKNIKSGSVVFVWGHSIISKIIMWYEKWDSKIGNNPSHAEIFFGSGCLETVSAEAKGVLKSSLNEYLGKKYKFEVYSYKGMAVDQLQDLKAFAYSRVNVVPYDFMNFFHFLGKIIHAQIPQWRFANFCSEIVADCFTYLGITLTGKDIPSGDQHPAMQWQYVKNSPLWCLDYTYDGRK